MVSRLAAEVEMTYEVSRPVTAVMTGWALLLIVASNCPERAQCAA
jgi:hypothetical protein